MTSVVLRSDLADETRSRVRQITAARAVSPAPAPASSLVLRS